MRPGSTCRCGRDTGSSEALPQTVQHVQRRSPFKLGSRPRRRGEALLCWRQHRERSECRAHESRSMSPLMRQSAARRGCER
jgi:hypothetical protein